MKSKKSTYFAIVFLLSFLTSFGINTYQYNSCSFHRSTVKVSKDIVLSSSLDANASQDNLLFEENENETEDGFELQSFVLPFFISYFQFEVSTPLLVSVKPLTEKLTNPIYIAVCNFRI